MMNDYCKNTIDYITKNYKNMLENFNYSSISIGGSIARGYGNELSDIDLICLGKNIEKYKKKFLEIDLYKIEIHEIPVNYLENIIKQLSFYINFPDFDNEKLKDIKLNGKAAGAKKCNVIAKKDNELTIFLSNWREFKKITDSIVIYETDDNFLTYLKNNLNKIIFKDTFFELLKLNDDFSNSDKIINLLKINSFINNDVFSKVLWIDLYLKKDFNSLISEMIFKKELHADYYKETFYNWYTKNLDCIYSLHKKHECDICKGDMMQCNIMRCINDYYNDTKKAKEKGYVFGEFFSIQRVLMYVKLLYDKSGYSDITLNKLIENFEFSDEECNFIDNIVRRSIDDKY